LRLVEQAVTYRKHQPILAEDDVDARVRSGTSLIAEKRQGAKERQGRQKTEVVAVRSNVDFLPWRPWRSLAAFGVSIVGNRQAMLTGGRRHTIFVEPSRAAACRTCLVAVALGLLDETRNVLGQLTIRHDKAKRT